MCSNARNYGITHTTGWGRNVTSTLQSTKCTGAGESLREILFADVPQDNIRRLQLTIRAVPRRAFSQIIRVARIFLRSSGNVGRDGTRN